MNDTANTATGGTGVAGAAGRAPVLLARPVAAAPAARAPQRRDTLRHGRGSGLDAGP